MAEENSRHEGGSTNPKFRERGGLIPITAKILHDSLVNQDEAVEYQGNILSDVCIVGYLKEFRETDTKVLTKIWDQTGMVDTVFYNKNENEIHSGLTSFISNLPVELNKLVKIFGTVKPYKKEKNLQGAKIMYVSDNELIYHQLEVVNDWLYLTGKINSLKVESDETYGKEVKNLARTHNNNSSNNYPSTYNNHNNDYSHSSVGYSRSEFNNNPQMNSTEQIVLNTLKELSKRGNKVERTDLFKSLEMKNISQGQISQALKALNNSGFIFEDDDCFTVNNY